MDEKEKLLRWEMALAAIFTFTTSGTERIFLGGWWKVKYSFFTLRFVKACNVEKQLINYLHAIPESFKLFF